jgi:hypothetical protein
MADAKGQGKGFLDLAKVRREQWAHGGAQERGRKSKISPRLGAVT